MSIYGTPSRPRYSDYVPTNLSIYEYLKEKAHPFGTMTALRFYGVEYSYKQLFDNIDKAACALSASGIGKNDIVAVSLPGIPEAVYLLYAINKLGAKYCAFDCRSQKDEILDMIKKFGPKLCIVPDFQLKAFRNVTDCEIVYIDPAHSIGKFIKVSTFFADVFTGRSALRIKRKNIVKYDIFINRSNYAFSKTSSERSDDNVFGYFYTSGTTYGRKSIILTNENINSSVYQSSINESYVCAGESMLNIMPMFSCYGVTNATHLPLTLGVSVTLVPLVKTKKFKKLITKEKPNFIITVPAHWEYFARENFKGCDLSYLRTVIVGGDKLDPAYMEKINRIFKECNSSAFLRPGYGLSETTSIGTCSNESTPSGSVGLPYINTLMGIFDHDTLEELGPHQHGEICFYGPSICHGYYKDPEMTAKLLIKHPDGKVWLHTGDVGYTDESGYLYFCERLKRMYVRFDGTKISPYSIEETLRGCEVVHRCLVVPMRDTQHTHGMCARVLVVKKSGISEKDARHAIEKYAHIHLGEHMIPRELVFVERLPYTKNGKLDYFGNYAQDSH